MFEIDLEILEEAEVGKTRFRLVEDTFRKRRSVQLWSSLSKQWKTFAKYDVSKHWSTILQLQKRSKERKK